jgi:serine/threonine protein kinase
MGTQAAGADPLIGTTLGSYRVLARIGQGGMGAVYLAEHPVIGRRAAVKVILPEFSRSPELIGRFHNEARAAAQLRHPSFVDVFDFGTLPDGSSYLVMDFLEGQSLAACLKRMRSLPLAVVLGIARQIAVAVGIAHDHGIVHRDLKPDNVFLTPHPDGGGTLLVKVLDFGVAKLTQERDDVGPVTRTGAMLGTPLYMAPEQCRGAGKVDHRSDIYSLGCLLHAMLAGSPPFPFDGVGEVIGAHIYKPPPGLRSLGRSVPLDVEAWVLEMLAKDPAARPASMAAVVARADELRSALGHSSVISLAAVGISPKGSDGPESHPPVRSGETAVLPLDPTVPLPVSRVRKPVVDTTLGQSAASIAAPDDMVPRRQSGRHGRLVVGIAGALAIVAVIAVVVGSSGPTRRRPLVVVSRERESLPVKEIVSADPVPKAALVPAAPVEPEPTISLVIRSIPSGATVTDVKTGEKLGNTPFTRSFDRQQAPLVLTVEKRGFESKEASASLDSNGELLVKLNPKATASLRRVEAPKTMPSVQPAAPAIDPEAVRKL